MINIVMTVRDRFKLTRQALSTLYANTDPSTFNLTVVDDGSTDFRLANLYRHLSEYGNISVLTVFGSEHKLAKLKNIGVEWSRKNFGEGDYLYLSDNDVYFLPNWNIALTALADSTKKLDWRLWGGQSHPYHVMKSVTAGYGNDPIATFNEPDCLAGTSWLITWSSWKHYGGLTEDVAAGVCQSEDFEFTERIKPARIAVCNPPVIIDCGLTSSDGRQAPGYNEKLQVIQQYIAQGLNVYYE